MAENFERWDNSFSTGAFKGQNVLITGGGTGIGLLLAKIFGRYGANVMIASRKEPVLEAAQPLILAAMRAGGHYRTRCLFKRCDIRKEEEVREMVEYTLREFVIEVQINNSGANFLAPAKDITPNGWRTVIDICLNGTFLVSKYVGEAMIKEGTGGVIIMNAGTNAHGGSPMIAHSGSGKAGMISLAESLAAEWGKYGIRVNAVSPGSVITDGSSERLWKTLRELLGPEMGKNVPLGRFAAPEDVVGPILFLCTPAASFITGSNYIIDGGQRLSAMMVNAFNKMQAKM